MAGSMATVSGPPTVELFGQRLSILSIDSLLSSLSQGRRDENGKDARIGLFHSCP
jgi:hypothetical protein